MSLQPAVISQKAVTTDSITIEIVSYDVSAVKHYMYRALQSMQGDPILNGVLINDNVDPTQDFIDTSINQSTLYYYALVSEEAASPLVNGLQAYFQFEEESGSTAFDSHGNFEMSLEIPTGYSLEGDAVFTPNGFINRGVDCRAPGAGIHLLGATPLYSGEVGSFSFWFRLMSWDSVFSGEYSLLFDSNTAQLRTQGKGTSIRLRGHGGWTQTIPDNHIVLEQWHHIVVVSDGVDTQMYFDNSLVLTEPENTMSMPTNFVLGRHSDLQYDTGTDMVNFCDAYFDEFAVWNRALTSGEINDLYNNGNGLTYPFS